MSLFRFLFIAGSTLGRKMALAPKQSGKLISSLSKHVAILDDGIIKASEMVMKGLTDETISMASYKSHPLHPKDPTLPSAVDWIFLVDTLNFSFWSESGSKFEITYHDETYSGYWSLCAAINRAIEEGYDITSPEYYATVSLETLRHIFRSDSGIEIPLLKQRHKILNETGKSLIGNFDGTFKTCLESCNKSAQLLLRLVVGYFPSYRDETKFENQRVSFYKRAQILIGDIWCFFEGEGLGELVDIDTISMFADYRIPQLLVYLGVLKYSDRLQEVLENGEMMLYGHRYEVEIRGCTIWAVELMIDYIKQKQSEDLVPQNTKVNSILIDNFLWDYRREHAEEMAHIPFHKTRCIYY